MDEPGDFDSTPFTLRTASQDFPDKPGYLGTTGTSLPDYICKITTATSLPGLSLVCPSGTTRVRHRKRVGLTVKIPISKTTMRQGPRPERLPEPGGKNDIII